MYPFFDLDDLLCRFDASIYQIKNRAHILRLKKADSWKERRNRAKKTKIKITKKTKPKTIKMRRYEVRLLMDEATKYMSVADLCFLMPTRTPSDIVKMKIELGVE